MAMPFQWNTRNIIIGINLLEYLITVIMSKSIIDQILWFFYIFFFVDFDQIIFHHWHFFDAICTIVQCILYCNYSYYIFILSYMSMNVIFILLTIKKFEREKTKTKTKFDFHIFLRTTVYISSFNILNWGYEWFYALLSTSFWSFGFVFLLVISGIANIFLFENIDFYVQSSLKCKSEKSFFFLKNLKKNWILGKAQLQLLLMIYCNNDSC